MNLHYKRFKLFIQITLTSLLLEYHATWFIRWTYD